MKKMFWKRTRESVRQGNRTALEDVRKSTCWREVFAALGDVEGKGKVPLLCAWGRLGVLLVQGKMGSYDPIEYQNLIRAVAAQLQYVPELLNNNEMNDIIVSLNELAGVAYTKDLIQVAKMLEPVIVARDFVSHMPELTARFLYLFIYRLNLNGVITAAQDALLADATRASSPVIFNCLSRTNMLPKTVLGHVVYELKTLGIPAAWNEKALITGLNVLSQEGLKAKDRMRPEGIPVFLEGICVGGLRKLPVWAVTMLASTLASMRTHDDGVVRLLSHNIVKHRWVQFGVRDAAQIVESYTRLGLWYGEARVLMRGLEQDIDSMSFKDATALRLQWMIRGACAAASTVHLYDKLSNILTKYLHERGVYDLTALCVSYKHLAEVGYEGPNMDVLRTRIIKGLSDENLEHPRTRIFHFAGALSALDDKNPDMWHFIESLLVKHNMAENLDVIKSACFMQYFAKAGFAPHTFAQQLDEHFMKQGVSLTLNRFTATVFKECFVALPLDYPQFLMNRINAPDQRTLNDVSGVHLQKMKPYLFTMNRFKVI
eukprot:TRINITY_DN13684_c0_g1_i1.p1 TRINITY_DN13684_c0_g1~~TRINITY_DN13684_c0_g1_i1.p1  ORF type:complete len:544 (+),score=84.06 TRINITY_DN13684_c0_g1_i1:40-1671(+)